MKKINNLFKACLFLSLFVHAVCMSIFQRYALWFSPTQWMTTQEDTLTSLEKEAKDRFLRETFQQDRTTTLSFSLTPSYEILPEYPMERSSPQPTTATFRPCLTLQNGLNMDLIGFKSPVAISLEEKLSYEKPDIPYVPSLSLHETTTLPTVLFSESSSFFSPEKEKTSHSGEIASVPPALISQNQPKRVHFSTPSYSYSFLKHNSDKPAQSLSLIPIPELPYLPSLDKLNTVSYSDFFDTDLSFLPLEEGGYLFALTFIAREDLELPKLKQTFSFLIDRSNSIEKTRLHAAKNAVYKALEYLSEEDAFNIIAFDSKVDKLSQNPISCTPASTRSAKYFLDHIELGSFFATGNVFKPLFLTIPHTVEADELHTAIILTDGELLHKKGAQKSLIYEWTAHNQGRVSLYSVAFGAEESIPAIQTASAFNKGNVIYSSTTRGIKRKLLKLMKKISYPIVKDLSCSAITSCSQSKIHLYPKPGHLSHLYKNEPYVILGKIDALDDFILFIQGRIQDKWVHIKKPVSFQHAKEGSLNLKEEWALQQAYDLYEQYLYDENPTHLTEAKSLVSPHLIPSLFQ